MSDKVTVRFMTASAMVMNLLVWCVPSHAQHKLYDTSQTVTIEGEVASFAVGDEYATVSMFPLSEQKNSRTMWVVDWRSSGSLSGQGITAEWLKSGDRVVVTGNPHRIPGQRMMLLKTITRVSDGWKWPQGASPTSSPQAVQTNTPAPAPATASPAGIKAATNQPIPPTNPVTPKPPPSKASPEQTETLAERQAEINKDVTAKTNAIVADLKKKSDAQLAQAAAASQVASQAAAHQTAAQGQSPGGSAGPAWQPCGGDLRSGASWTVVPVEFVNTSKQPRKLYWFDFAAAKVLAGTLQPGQRAPMQTYTTHAWLITDGSDNCLGTLIISKPGAIEIR